MSGLFGGGSKKAADPPPPPPPPQVDDAVAKVNEQDKASRRQGRRSTILTGDAGLPDLGSTSNTGM